MERDLIVFAVLAFAAWRYINSMMSHTVRSAITFEKARDEIRTGDMLLVGDCGGGASAWAAAANAAVRIADMSPWTEVCVAKRTSEGTVHVWQPSTYSVVPLDEFAASHAGCVAVRPLQCSEQQRSFVQTQFDAAVQQIQAAGTANAVDAVSSYMYRHSKTSNPRPAHTGVTCSEAVSFFYHSCGAFQDERGVYGVTAGEIAAQPPTTETFKFGPAVFIRPPKHAASALHEPLHTPPTEAEQPPENPADDADAGGWPSRESGAAQKLQVSDVPPLSAQALASVPSWFKLAVRSSGNR